MSAAAARPMPEDEIAERAVIGALMGQPQLIDTLELDPGDFSDFRLGHVFRIMRTLRVEEIVADPTTIEAAFAREGMVERTRLTVVGIAVDCMSSHLVDENIQHYATLVIRGAAKRKMAKAMTDASQALARGENPDEVKDRIRRQLKKRPARRLPTAQEPDPQTVVFESHSPLTVATIVEGNMRGVVEEVDETSEFQAPRIELNTMTGEVEINRKTLEEDELSDIGIRIEDRFRGPRGGGMKQSMADLFRGVKNVARRYPYHPVCEYLQSCEAQWDGVGRVDMLLERGMKVPVDKLSVTMMRHWLTGAVIRARWPGSKMDNMLLLVGQQGLSKSSFFRALGGQWFLETDVDVGSEEAPAILRMGWIIELAEMEAMLRARDQSGVRAFVTRQEDPVRLKYSRLPVKLRRSFVFGASTNEDFPLTDETGNRRSWPFRCSKPFDVDFLATIRDQLWGEAAARVTRLLGAGTLKIKNGVAEASPKSYAWWLTPEEELELQTKQAAFQSSLAWTAPVLQYCDGRDEVTVQEIMKHLEIPKERWNNSKYMRDIATILRADGWHHKGHTRKRGAYWSKPTSP